jgi:3-methyladenine DNA glycosylase AlkC
MAKKVKKIPKFYLKDQLFNREKVEKLAKEIFAVYTDFKQKDFIEDVMTKFPELELKERIHHITEMLWKYLPKDYSQAITIIKKALPKELDNTKKDKDFWDFIYAPYGQYIAKYGLDTPYLWSSLHMLEEITKRFSAEYAIRDFWNTFEKEVHEKFLEWSKSEHYHVRRLASEGSRPKLPWGKKIQLHYKKTEKILDNLFYDSTRYVTRSVANHLNDISKIDTEFVIRKLQEWEKSGKQEKKEMEFIKHHATRTLRKKELLWGISKLKQKKKNT